MMSVITQPVLAAQVVPLGKGCRCVQCTRCLGRDMKIFHVSTDLSTGHEFVQVSCKMFTYAS